MNKERRDEIIDLLIERLKSRYGYQSGICLHVVCLRETRKISIEEHCSIDAFMRKHRPKSWIKYDPYWFPEPSQFKDGLKQRLAFLESLKQLP